MKTHIAAVTILSLALAGTVVSQDGNPKPYLVCRNGQTPGPGQGPCATPPRISVQIKAKYTDEAQRNSIEGRVVLSLVVGADGKTSEVNVVRGLGYGLDQAAIDAVQQWRFLPGTFQGEPVPVEINVTVNFQKLATELMQIMTKELNLTDDQQQKIKALLEEEMQQTDPMRQTLTDKRIWPILNDDQQQKLREMLSRVDKRSQTPPQ